MHWYVVRLTYYLTSYNCVNITSDIAGEMIPTGTAERVKGAMKLQEMTAVMCHGPRDYRVERAAMPKAGPHEIVIRIGACGICASDCKCWQGASMFWEGPDGPYVKTPVIPGHEFFGYVHELGEGAGEHFGVALGDKVIAEQILPCNRCRYCTSGSYWMCERHYIYGFQKGFTDGGMAQFMRLASTARVHKIPQDLPLEACAIIEPLACAIHTVNRGTIELADTVVIAGAGPLGLLMTQVARLKTPKKLVVVDPLLARRDLALRYGADVAIDPREGDAVQQVMGLTDGYGCDVYIETTGAPVGVRQGLQMIRKLGRFVEFSVFGEETTVDWSIIGDRKELDVRGAHLGPYCYPIAIDLLSRGLVTSDGIVTHRYALEQWDEALAMALSPDSVKVILIPSD